MAIFYEKLNGNNLCFRSHSSGGHAGIVEGCAIALGALSICNNPNPKPADRKANEARINSLFVFILVLFIALYGSTTIWSD
jgi:hypothetical protein